MVNINIKDAQRQALVDAVKEYQARGNKVSRCRMVRQRHKWMSIPKSAKQRVLRYADLVTTSD